MIDIQTYYTKIIEEYYPGIFLKVNKLLTLSKDSSIVIDNISLIRSLESLHQNIDQLSRRLKLILPAGQKDNGLVKENLSQNTLDWILDSHYNIIRHIERIKEITFTYNIRNAQLPEEFYTIKDTLNELSDAFILIKVTLEEFIIPHIYRTIHKII